MFIISHVFFLVFFFDIFVIKDFLVEMHGCTAEGYYKKAIIGHKGFRALVSMTSIVKGGKTAV